MSGYAALCPNCRRPMPFDGLRLVWTCYCRDVLVAYSVKSVVLLDQTAAKFSLNRDG